MRSSLSLNQDGAEQVAYNKPGFPVRCVNSCLSVFNDFAAACHWHYDYEFLLARKGEIDYFVNGDIVHFSEGQAIFLNSNRLHYGFSRAKRECLYSVILFHPSVLGESPLPTAQYTARLSADDQRDYLVFDPSSPFGSRALMLLQNICDLCAVEGALYEFAVQGACGQLITLIFQSIDLQGDTAYPDPAWQSLRQMTGYLQANYTQTVRLADIAAAGAVCRSKCCDLFRTRLGKTPMEYLTQYRLEKACQLIRNTELPITQIAHACGFDSASYFSETFRKVLNVSPRRFRREK